MVSPASRIFDFPSTIISALPSTIYTTASNGVVCSLNPSPLSKANKEMLPDSFLSICLLTTALSA